MIIKVHAAERGILYLIGQSVVFSSFPRLNVEDSRSKNVLGQIAEARMYWVKKPTLSHLLF
jgi:hypothetical protein